MSAFVLQSDSEATAVEGESKERALAFALAFALAVAQESQQLAENSGGLSKFTYELVRQPDIHRV